MDHVPYPSGNAFPNVPLDTAGLVCSNTTRAFSAKLLSSWSAFMVHEIFYPRFRTFHSSLLNFMRILPAPVSSLLVFLLMSVGHSDMSWVTTLPSHVSSAKLLRVHFVPAFRSLRKILHCIGFIIDTWVHYLPSTGLCATDHNTWAQPFSWFSTCLTIHLPNALFQLLCEGDMGDSVKCFIAHLIVRRL